MSLPKFNFANSDIKSTEELNKELDADKKTRHFRTGNYEAKCVKVEHQGPAYDQTWHKILVTWEGVAGQTITDQIMVPTSRIKFRGEKGESLFKFKALQGFCKAVFGVDLTVENLGDTLTQLFGNVEKTLVGRQATLTIGYRGNHIYYDGKNQDGSKRYAVKMRNGEFVKNDSGVTAVFPDYTAAENFAETKEIEIRKFPDVLSYGPSANARPLQVVGGGW